MHKTILTKNKKAKHTSNEKTKTRRGEREKVTKSWKNLFVLQNTQIFFLPHLGRTFSFGKHLIQR